MPESDITRRKFLERMAILGAAIGAAPLVAACGTQAPSTSPGTGAGGEGAAADLDCTDTTGLTESEVQTRTSLQYVDKSEKPDQFCNNCQQFKPAADATTCGGCNVVPGKINPNGWCISWVVKTT